jgi:anti-sigma B factor antagonist
MQVQGRIVERVAILSLKGNLTPSVGDTLMRDTVHSLVNRGCKELVLDLSGVPYIDSAGIGEIVAIHTAVTRRHGTLKLLNVPKRIRDLLVITKLLTVFETFDDATEAVRTFFTAV